MEDGSDDDVFSRLELTTDTVFGASHLLKKKSLRRKQITN